MTAYTPEQQALLNRARNENVQIVPPRIREIKIAGKDLENVQAGHYFIQDYDTEAKKKVLRDIGTNPQIIILKKAATYSYYSDKLERLIAWTSDINGYTEFDPVILFKNDGKNRFVEFKGNYKEFKTYAEKNYTILNPIEEKVDKLLKFKTVLYVQYEGETYRMFVSNPGVAGIAEGATTADFKKPQLLSLTHYLDQVADLSGDSQGAACFEAICQLGSTFIEDSKIPFYVMQFTCVGPNPNYLQTLDAYGELLKNLENQLRDDIHRMSSVKAEVVEPVKLVEVLSPEDMATVFGQS